MNKPKLSVIDGGRAELEIEALKLIGTDFEKFLAMARSLGKPANGSLTTVEEKPSEGQSAVEESTGITGRVGDGNDEDKAP